MVKIANILFSYYPEDVRPRIECETLVEAGMQVDLICLMQEGQLAEERVNGVNVYRLPVQRSRGGKLSYIREYISFIIRSFVKLSALYLKKKYDVIHVHTMPDILVFSALLPKICGKKVLLDMHDPMPELFITKYNVDADHPLIRTLCFLERVSIGLADSVITPNIAFKQLFISRGCPEQKISIVMNSPVERLFSVDADALPQSQTGQDFVVMYHGSIFERHGVDTALQAVAKLRDQIPRLKLKVFGTGDYVQELHEMVRQLHLEGIVQYNGVVSWECIAEEIRTIDVGIIPNKKTPFTEINVPVRIFEYLSLGKPVIVPKTRGISDYFDEESLFYFEAGDADSLCREILQIYHNKEKAQDVVRRGMKIYHEHRWEVQKEVLVDKIISLSGAC